MSDQTVLLIASVIGLWLLCGVLVLALAKSAGKPNRPVPPSRAVTSNRKSDRSPR